MKSKKERKENLTQEKFYFVFFEGTYMPNNPKYIEIIVFDDVFYISNEKEEKENRGDMYWIMKVKKLIEDNLENIEKMEVSNGNPIKSSFNGKFILKIDNKIYEINRNICGEEGQKLFDDFKCKLYETLNIKDK